MISHFSDINGNPITANRNDIQAMPPQKQIHKWGKIVLIPNAGVSNGNKQDFIDDADAVAESFSKLSNTYLARIKNDHQTQGTMGKKNMAQPFSTTKGSAIKKRRLNSKKAEATYDGDAPLEGGSDSDNNEDVTENDNTTTSTKNKKKKYFYYNMEQPNVHNGKTNMLKFLHFVQKKDGTFDKTHSVYSGGKVCVRTTKQIEFWMYIFVQSQSKSKSNSKKKKLKALLSTTDKIQTVHHKGLTFNVVTVNPLELKKTKNGANKYCTLYECVANCCVLHNNNEDYDIFKCYVEYLMQRSIFSDKYYLAQSIELFGKKWKCCNGPAKYGKMWKAFDECLIKNYIVNANFMSDSRLFYKAKMRYIYNFNVVDPVAIIRGGLKPESHDEIDVDRYREYIPIARHFGIKKYVCIVCCIFLFDFIV